MLIAGFNLAKFVAFLDVLQFYKLYILFPWYYKNCKLQKINFIFKINVKNTDSGLNIGSPTRCYLKSCEMINNIGTKKTQNNNNNILPCKIVLNFFSYFPFSHFE